MYWAYIKGVYLLTAKICSLLSHHQITVLDKNTMYRVIMAGQEFDGDGTLLASNMVQVAEFERIQGGHGAIGYRRNSWT